MIPTEKEITQVINTYIQDYTNYENEVFDVTEFLKVEEDKARLLVLKRYPQLQLN